MSAFSDTSDTFNVRRNEYSSTYIVQDRQNKEELLRLTIQDQLFTEATSGMLAELELAAQFRQVLDIGSGTGGWLIEMASSYPKVSLVGIDISQSMVDYATDQALARGVDTRVSFRVMDALALPAFAKNSFDLVNLRFGSSYLRTWEWPQVLREIARVTRPGGLIQLTDAEVIQPGTSSALRQLCEMFLCALYNANHLSEQAPAGIVPHLPTFLEELRCQSIQTHPQTIEYRAGSSAGDAFCQDAKYIFRTVRPFIQKWGCMKKDYDALYQQLLIDMQQPEFHASINFSTIWGRAPG
ncbi:MAG: hypothetical protein PVSMB5_05380 [Ktedonobacteraceae bacterium]